MPFSLIEIIKQCHNHDPWSDQAHWSPFLLSPGGPQIGFLAPSVQRALSDHVASVQESGRSSELVVAAHGKSDVSFSFSEHIHTFESRSQVLKALVTEWRDADLFPDPLNGWRNELYAIYGPNPNPTQANQPAFALERAACALFGFATFGVHLTAYTPDMKIWVPRRAKTKATWPGYLDNSVAGGITAGDLPRASMVRECEEEASLSPHVVEPLLKQTGVISYFYQSSAGWCQPEVEYTYDLPVPADLMLTPADGEAESFELMDHEQVLRIIKDGKFKANCSLVLIDFFIRHGVVTCENEPQYLEVLNALHNDIGLPGP